MSKRKSVLSGMKIRPARTFEKRAGHGNVDTYFGCNVFDQRVMKERLSKEVYNKLISTIEHGQTISPDIVEPVAQAVKDWALENGVSHFCHWFQPQTGFTAEKHDSIFEIDETGKTIEKFSASNLKQAEPDASSFPSGGMRSTFEARGYTTWDPSSPIFIYESLNGKTLCIPSAFISYTGEALDEKTPLLRSLDKINAASKKLLSFIGKKVDHVSVTVGAEQEYFLFDRMIYENRPDLLQLGKTVLGYRSPRGQQLEDHYFGSIPDRVLAFMHEVEYEAAKLGIPVKTRHNEVAPSQYEIAPLFEDANKAIDHNLLLMDIMNRIAYKHGLGITFYEKPFAGINGSGKHCNWSLQTSDGINLLSPGKTPGQNIAFLLTLSAVLKAVHEGGDILRASVSTAANDHRLGACEAPPAIISVFMGGFLESILEKIETQKSHSTDNWDRVLELGVGRLLDVKQDNTDRNRTSPFAFTSNKFEFRAVGGSQNTSVPMTILNTLVANAMEEIAEKLESKVKNGQSVEAATFDVIRETVVASKPVRFSGNGYEEAWITEATKRGLPHLKTSPDAFDALLKPANIKKLSKVFTETELKARVHIAFERFSKTKMMETEMFLDLVNTQIIPACIEHTKKYHGAPVPAAKALEDKYNKELNALIENTGKLRSEMDNLRSLHDEIKGARILVEKIDPLMANVRSSADYLESVTADEIWPLAKYSEILFSL